MKIKCLKPFSVVNLLTEKEALSFKQLDKKVIQTNLRE